MVRLHQSELVMTMGVFLRVSARISPFLFFSESGIVGGRARRGVRRHSENSEVIMLFSSWISSRDEVKSVD